MRASLGLLMVIAATSPAAGQDASGGASQTAGPNIIVTPPPTEAERHRDLRDFTREVIRPPRINQPLAKFAIPFACRCSDSLRMTPP